MKIDKRAAAMALCVLAVLLLLPVRTLAAGRIDLDRDASLTVTARCGDLELSGVTFEIYLVSNVDETGELTPVEAFRKFAAGLDIRGKDDAAWQDMADTLEREILLGGLGDIEPTDSAVTDAAGTARFPSEGKKLSMGLYLVLGTRTEKNGQVYVTSPFFVLLPAQDPETNEWNYDMTVKTKASPPGESTDPTESAEPTNPTNPVLPQTGVLWWPVPVLLAAGLLCMVIGLFRRRGARR